MAIYMNMEFLWIMICVYTTYASHTVFSQYEGNGYVPLETQGDLVPTDAQQISCAFTGSSPVDIAWKWRNGTRSFEPDHYFDQPVSKIGSGDSQITSSYLVWMSGITETDKRSASGIIYAEGTHQGGSGVSTCDDVSLTIIWKPGQTPSLSKNKNRFVIGEDSMAQLTCQLTDKGNPEGRARWIKNENLQSESVYNTPTISISVTRDIDGDKWQCYFDNIAGDGDYSDEVIINVHWKPEQPSLSINKNPLVIGEDSAAQLTCQLTDKGNPGGQVAWIKNGNLLSGSHYNTEMISIPVTRDIDGDKWQCYYNNTAGEGDHSDEFTINVHWTPGQTPALSINKNQFVIGEDSMAQLTCQLKDKGNPEGQVRWMKNGNLQKESEYNTQTISIPVTKDIDGDKWQCYYYNVAEDGGFSDEVIVNVHWKPEQPSLSINKNAIVIGEDTAAQLTCQLTDKGNPGGQVAWIKNGNLLSGSHYNTEMISIPVTRDIDGDKWQCYYYNTAGKGDHSDEFTINVHWSPGGASISADTHTPKRDDILKFTCTGDRGNPSGRVLWYLDTRLVANTTSKQYAVTNVKESQNGNWSCMFSNYLNDGSESQSIQIQVVLTPEQGEVRITSVTANNAIINATPKTNTQKARRSTRSTTHTNMNITWYSDDQNNTVLVPPETTQYALYNLTANTNYTIEVSYINDQGIGAAATAYVTTKEFPLNLEVDPSIKRSWFSAVATLDIANSNSVARVEMLVCESTDEMNCVNKSTTDIKNGTLEVKETSINGRYVTLSLYDEGFLIAMYSDDIDAPIVAFVLIGLGGLLVIVLIIVVIVVIIKKQGKGGKEKDMPRGAADGGTDTYSYSNPTLMANSQSRTGTGHAKALNAQPVYAEVPKGRTLAPIAVSADGGIYSQVEMSKKNARQSLKGLPMSKKAIDRIIFHKKDGYVNMTFQVRKKFIGDIEIGVCREGDQSCTSKVSKQHEGGSKDVVMVLPIEEMSPESYSIHMKFIERGQVTQTVDLTYPYNKNLVNVAVLNEVYGTTASHNDRPTNVVSPSNADIEVEGVPQRPPRQGAPGEGVTYAVMDWNRSQAPGRPPRLSSRSPAQEHVVYAHVRPGGNVN